jgi:hypothetical protein
MYHSPNSSQSKNGIFRWNNNKKRKPSKANKSRKQSHKLSSNLLQSSGWSVTNNAMNILAYQAKSNPYQANSNLKHKNMRHPKNKNKKHLKNKNRKNLKNKKRKHLKNTKHLKNKNSSSVRLIGASGKIIKSKNTILYKAV